MAVTPTGGNSNASLGAARSAKKDEFYTQLSDIERELRHYRKHFKGKVVYCNADDPRISNFFHYFSHNFERLGLKKLITTCFRSQERDLFSQNDSDHAIYLEYEGDRGICPVCMDHFTFEEMEADHKKAWRNGGKTVPGNCQMLCIKHNRLKSGY